MTSMGHQAGGPVLRFKGGPLAVAVLAFGLAHSAHAGFTSVTVKRGFSTSARAQEFAPNCSPCGEDEEPWIIKGPDNFKELYGYDANIGDYGTHDLTLGNQSLSFQADYRGMHAAASTSRTVNFLSPDVIEVSVKGHIEVDHPGGEDLLRDKGVVGAGGHSFTDFGFAVDRPTTVKVTLDLGFRDLVAPVGAVTGGVASTFTFTGHDVTKSYTQADLANGPVSFITTLTPNFGTGVEFSASASRAAEAAGHGASDWQARLTIQAVPEPSGWALFSCALFAGAWILRRERKVG